MVFLLKILNLGFITTLLFSVTLTLTVGVTVFLEAKLKEFQIEIQRKSKKHSFTFKEKTGIRANSNFCKRLHSTFNWFEETEKQRGLCNEESFLCFKKK